MNTPLIRIERGNPDDIEIAAVLAALLCLAEPEVEIAPPAPAPVRWIGPRRTGAYVPSHSWAAA